MGRLIVCVVLCGCQAGQWPVPELEDQLNRLPVFSDGPAQPVAPSVHRVGDAARGREVFRFETFGNEGFWTRAARLPEGFEAVRLTPLQALKLGLSFDLEAMDPMTRKALAAELNKSFLSGPLLNSHETLNELLDANALIGLVKKGSALGVTCALCHAITDSALLDNPTGGSIGRRDDGRAAHTIRVGALFALAANTRALLPLAQLAQPDGSTIGRAARGLTKASNEAELDAYFSDPALYPPGSFDGTADGVGNPLPNGPAFRADLAAPWGSGGELATLDQYTNCTYTLALDPTALLTPGGRAFLQLTAGSAGEGLASDYAEVLAATAVTGFPFVRAEPRADALLGRRVDEQALLDLNAYLNSLEAPSGAVVDTGAADRGRELFRGSAGCTACHNVTQTKPVSAAVFAMKDVFPGDAPRTVGQRDGPMGPALDTAAAGFDDEMIFLNATLRGLERGAALPVLLDLTRKPVFLHDGSVPSLDALLDPSRGPGAPHPFYLADPAQRSEVVRFLQRLDGTRR